MRSTALLLMSFLALAGAVEPAWDDADRAAITAREAAAARVADGWECRTPHYRVLAESSARLAAEVATYLELARPAILAELGLRLREGAACDVVVHASRARYRAVFGAINSRGRFDWNYADDQAAPTYAVATFQADAARGVADVIPILTHECTHQLLQAAAGRRRIPWLVQEGIATYFQTWDPFRDAGWNHAHHRGEFLFELIRARDDHRLPALPALARLEVWDADGFGPVTNTRYGCAESLIGFLIGDERRRTFARRLIDAALGGDDIAALLAGGEGARLESAWRRAVADLRP
jgi:hypothetical protein